jgi:hypothetical protein
VGEERERERGEGGGGRGEGRGERIETTFLKDILNDVYNINLQVPLHRLCRLDLWYYECLSIKIRLKDAMKR